MQNKPKEGLRSLTMTAVMAAVLAVVSPFALPVGLVPISLCSLVLYLSVYVLGGRRATLAALVYILMGVVGLPVFSGFSGGVGKVMGPTGGYILGYLPMTALSGWMVDHFPRSRPMQLLGALLGTAVLYALGTAWFCFQSGTTAGAALALCVLPFLPGDGVKLVVALGLGPGLRKRLVKASLLPEN